MKGKMCNNYSTLELAKVVARLAGGAPYNPTPIYLESDGSYSVGKPNDRKAQFYIAIDRGGIEYTKKWLTGFDGKKRHCYVKI